jgi:hypothetical protein
MTDAKNLDEVPDYIPIGQVYRFMVDDDEPVSLLPLAAPTYSSVLVTDEEKDGGYTPCTVVWGNKDGDTGMCLRSYGHDGHHSMVCNDENGDERVVAIWGNHPDVDVPYDFAVRFLGFPDKAHRHEGSE